MCEAELSEMAGRKSSPEICKIVVIKISRCMYLFSAKADNLYILEGSNHTNIMASYCDTTGVLEHGMSS